MSTFPIRILLATDGSADATLAAQTAADLAAKTESELHMAHVGETSVPPFYARKRGQIEREARALLDEQVRKAEESGWNVAGSHVRVGEPAKELLVLAQELQAGMVVIGGRGKGPVSRYLTGDVAEAVFRHAPCPVLVVRETESG